MHTRHVPFLLFLALSLSPGCSCNNRAGEDVDAQACTTGLDQDGDGYGVNCPAGEDCNDFDPALHDDCCGAGPYTGCPCDPSSDSQVVCFDGPDNLSGTLPCMRGTRDCDPATSEWTQCFGQVLPQPEACDGVNNDCDGGTDEGVLSACGNCIPGCGETAVGQAPFPIPPPGGSSDGVGLDPQGDLILDSTQSENHFIWIANDPEGTVSKLDTRTGREVARYASVTHDPGRVVDHTGGRPFAAWNQNANGDGYADNRPSRTAIDFYNDMWVANRAHSGGVVQPSLTKVFNDVTDCTDINGNTLIDTSTDVDGDGVINVNDPLEFFGEADECIAMTVVVGANDGWARAVAIDAGDPVDPGPDPGNVWVGMFNEGAYYQINGATGALLQRVATPGHQPYGAAIDGDGNLWSADNCCDRNVHVGRIVTTMNPAPFTEIVAPPGTNGTYGIVVDLNGRVWFGGYPHAILHRYDPATGAWASFTVAQSALRGVGIDTRGYVWAAAHPGGVGYACRAWAADPNDPAHPTQCWSMTGSGGSSNTPVGIGIDFDGHAWTVNQGTSNASRLALDINGDPVAHMMTGNMVDVFPVGPSPYTYSDFTGLGLRTVTRPSGEYRIPIQGCMDPSQQARWISVTWNATTPPNTRVELDVRAGDDLATLWNAPLFGTWLMSPADLQIPPGPVPDSVYLGVIIRLISEDRMATPIVHDFSVMSSCPIQEG